MSEHCGRCANPIQQCICHLPSEIARQESCAILDNVLDSDTGLSFTEDVKATYAARMADYLEKIATLTARLGEAEQERDELRVHEQQTHRDLGAVLSEDIARKTAAYLREEPIKRYELDTPTRPSLGTDARDDRDDDEPGF